MVTLVLMELKDQRYVVKNNLYEPLYSVLRKLDQF